MKVVFTLAWQALSEEEEQRKRERERLLSALLFSSFRSALLFLLSPPPTHILTPPIGGRRLELLLCWRGEAQKRGGRRAEGEKRPFTSNGVEKEG